MTDGIPSIRILSEVTGYGCSAMYGNSLPLVYRVAVGTSIKSVIVYEGPTSLAHHRFIRGTVPGLDWRKKGWTHAYITFDHHFGDYISHLKDKKWEYAPEWHDTVIDVLDIAPHQVLDDPFFETTLSHRLVNDGKATDVVVFFALQDLDAVSTKLAGEAYHKLKMANALDLAMPFLGQVRENGFITGYITGICSEPHIKFSWLSRNEKIGKANQVLDALDRFHTAGLIVHKDEFSLDLFSCNSKEVRFAHFNDVWASDDDEAKAEQMKQARFLLKRWLPQA